MAYPTPSYRDRLAQLLQEAHDTQKYNTRRLEEGYHALRTSTRRLERLWSTYCEELERELGVKRWQDVTRFPDSIGILKQHGLQLDVQQVEGDRFPHLTSADSSSQHPSTSKPPNVGTRPRSNNLQIPQPQPASPIIQGPRPITAPTQSFPSRYNTAPSSRQKPAAYELQRPRPISSSQIEIPKRHASLPTREYLVSLSTSRPSDPQPQQRTNHQETKPDAVEDLPPLPKLDDAYFQSKKHYDNGTLTDGKKVNANHRSADQIPGKKYTVEAFKVPMTHEALAYEPGMQGHWGGPSNGKTEDQGMKRKPGSVGRAKLQKKR
ncbi:MAG: hypothetical protein LQ337_001914 [Flavoplaca oasis]|nr:MAG: hypothetical protein LQ337_001914 [Flavoplaca oasis]